MTRFLKTEIIDYEITNQRNCLTKNLISISKYEKS